MVYNNYTYKVILFLQSRIWKYRSWIYIHHEQIIVYLFKHRKGLQELITSYAHGLALWLKAGIFTKHIRIWIHIKTNEISTYNHEHEVSGFGASACTESRSEFGLLSLFPAKPGVDLFSVTPFYGINTVCATWGQIYIVIDCDPEHG